MDKPNVREEADAHLNGRVRANDEAAEGSVDKDVQENTTVFVSDEDEECPDLSTQLENDSGFAAASENRNDYSFSNPWSEGEEEKVKLRIHRQ